MLPSGLSLCASRGRTAKVDALRFHPFAIDGRGIASLDVDKVRGRGRRRPYVSQSSMLYSPSRRSGCSSRSVRGRPFRCLRGGRSVGHHCPLPRSGRIMAIQWGTSPVVPSRVSFCSLSTPCDAWIASASSVESSPGRTVQLNSLLIIAWGHRASFPLWNPVCHVLGLNRTLGQRMVYRRSLKGARGTIENISVRPHHGLVKQKHRDLGA